MRMRGGGNLPRGAGPCSDCSHPGKTVSCRVHFASVGKKIRALRVWQKKAPERELEEKRRVIRRAAEEHMDRSCCARFEDGRKECGKKYCEIHMRRSAFKRVAHVSRRLHETNHPSASTLSVAARVGIDILHPEGHSDSQCRNNEDNENNENNLSFAECVGRSLLHHVAKKHGLDAATARRRMEQVGVEMGGAVQHLAKIAGFFKEGGSSFGGRADAKEGRSEKARTGSGREDAKVASDMLREWRQREQRKHPRGAGRRMEEEAEEESKRTESGQGEGAGAAAHGGRQGAEEGELEADGRHSTRRMEAVGREDRAGGAGAHRGADVHPPRFASGAERRPLLQRPAIPHRALPLCRHLLRADRERLPPFPVPGLLFARRPPARADAFPLFRLREARPRAERGEGGGGCPLAPPSPARCTTRSREM